MFTRTVDVIVFVCGIFDLFNVMYKQHQRMVLHPFLNGTKKGDIDGRCKLWFNICVNLYRRLKPSLHFIHWNQEGWKTGLCSVPPVGHPYSLLTLANNTCVRHSFTDLRDRFHKLYKRKVNMLYRLPENYKMGLFMCVYVCGCTFVI